ncbi:MAG: asparaginase [Oscillospiraceae bacterium]|nr:asparaginase [Oscillospiraceae bacterium]
MKILMIVTGGTIGSRVSNGWVGLDSDTRDTLLEHAPYHPSEFTVITPYTVLSEQLSAQELNLLQETVALHIQNGYDGIIITHGTDTLQYSAAAIEYAFGGCELPIVFVSADFPLEDPRTNGNANFEAAVEFIRARAGNGVFVSHRNATDSKTDLHIASHVLAHGECSADLFSIEGTPYATYDGTITVHGSLLDSAPLGVVRYTETSGVLLVTAAPGDAFSYCLDGVQAVLLKPYHSATLNTASEAFKAFCKRAQERGIPVFALNVKSGVSYESTKAFDALGIHALPYSTAISAYMKLWAGMSLERNLATTRIAQEILNG